MQRWEYLDVITRNRQWADSRGREGVVSAMPQKGWSQNWALSSSLANQLGDEGWELTGMVSYLDGYWFVFKRPRL